ncbi:MAG TPA: DUF2877 domain-containing protein [Nitrososphaerales archaeon]|nr:DUF2877 domain-containing protein [Nitrososphaerales archaeon]
MIASSSMIFQADSIGSEVLSILRSDYEGHQPTGGTVHSVFDKAFNILSAHEVLVGVVTSSVGEGPFNVVLPTDSSLKELGVRRGEKCIITEDSFKIGSSLSIRTLGSRIYSSEHNFTSRLLQPSEIRSNVKTMEEIVRSRGRFEGLGPLIGAPKHGSGTSIDLFRRQTLSKVADLLRAIEEKEINGVEESAGALVGIGYGLTPAADDLLCGIMLSSYLLTENLGGDLETVRRMNQIIASRSEERTTVLSSQHLKQAALGNGNEFSVGTVRDLATSHNNTDIESSAAKLLAVGSTSGTDNAIGIILGSYLALKMLPHFGYRR